MKKDLGITKQDIWTSNTASLLGTIFLRFVNGPLCDKYGARLLFGIVLMGSAIPTACIGLINSPTTLTVTRFFIGLGGSTFVMCQMWTTRMFTKEVAGTANALAGGWGIRGVTQLVMGPLLYWNELRDRLAYCVLCIVQVCVGFLTGFTILRISDDCPKGNYKEMKANRIMNEVSASASFRDGAMDSNTWIFFIQYLSLQ